MKLSRVLVLGGLLAGCGTVTPSEGRKDSGPTDDAPVIVDAMTTDAPAPDAMGAPVYDVAYPSQWRFSISDPVSGYLLVVNRSQAPLNMRTLQVKSISDDHPTAVVRIAPMAAGGTIGPGLAGGSLSGLSETLLVTSGIVSERRTDTSSDYLSIEIVDPPPGAYDINVAAVLSIENADVAIPMVIHMLPGPTIYADPEVGRRATAYR